MHPPPRQQAAQASRRPRPAALDLDDPHRSAEPDGRVAVDPASTQPLPTQHRKGGRSRPSSARLVLDAAVPTPPTHPSNPDCLSAQRISSPRSAPSSDPISPRCCSWPRSKQENHVASPTKPRKETSTRDSLCPNPPSSDLSPAHAAAPTRPRSEPQRRCFLCLPQWRLKLLRRRDGKCNSLWGETIASTGLRHGTPRSRTRPRYGWRRGTP